MLRNTKSCLILLGMLLTANTTFAITASNFETTSFATSEDNARYIQISNIVSTAVTYDEGDQEDSLGFLVCDIEVCSTSISTSQGLVSIEGGDLVYTPTDPSSTEPLTIDYEVSVVNDFNEAPNTSRAQLTITFTNSAVTNNQNLLSVKGATDNFCDGNRPGFQNLPTQVQDTCNLYNFLTGDEQINALSTISPEEVVAEFTSTLNMTKDQTSNLSNRLNALRGGASGFSVAGLNYHQGDNVLSGQWLHEIANQVGGNASAEQNFSPLGFFINGSITDGDKDTTSLEQGYDLEGDSITLGMDYRFNESLVAGVAYGISDTEISFETSGNDMSNEIDNLLLYGSWYQNNFYLDALIGYASGDITTKRTISVSSINETVGSINETVGGKTESSQLFLSLTGNYDFVKNAWTYGPYASLDYIDGEIKGYEEIGTTGFEIGFADQDIKSQIVTLGGRVQYAWSQPWGIVIPHARAEWKSELEDERTAIVGRFILDTSGDTFTIEADDLDSSWYQLGVGVSATFQRGLSAYIDYEEVISYDDTSLSTFSFGGRWEAKF